VKVEKERVAVDRSLAGIVRSFHVPNLFYEYELLHGLPINSIGKKLTICFFILLACLYLPIAMYYQSMTHVSVHKWDIGVEFEKERAARGDNKSQFQEFVEQRLRDKFTEVSRREGLLTPMQCPCQGMEALHFLSFASIRVRADFCEPVPLAFLEFSSRANARELLERFKTQHEQLDFSGTPVYEQYLKDPAKGLERLTNDIRAELKNLCRSVNESAPGCFEDNSASAALTLCNVAQRFAYVEAQNLLQSWLPYSGELLIPEHWDSMQKAMRETFVRQVKAQSQALREYGYARDMVEQPVTMWNHHHRKPLQTVVGRDTSLFLLDFDRFSGKIGGRNEQTPNFCDWQTEDITRVKHCSGVRYVEVLMSYNNKSLDEIDAMLANFDFDYGAYASSCWAKGHQCQWTENSQLTYLEMFGALFACLGSIILVAKVLTNNVLVFFLKRPAQQETKGVAKTSNESIETGSAEVPVSDANDDCHHSSAGTASVAVEVAQTDERGYLILSLKEEFEQLKSQMRDLEHVHRQALLESSHKERQLRDESQDAIVAQQQHMESLDADIRRPSKEYLINLRAYV